MLSERMLSTVVREATNHLLKLNPIDVAADATGAVGASVPSAAGAAGALDAIAAKLANLDGKTPAHAGAHASEAEPGRLVELGKAAAEMVERYTMHPSADTRTHLPEPVPGQRYMLYAHVPFCERLCPYCSFNRFPFEREKALRYFKNLRAEMLMLRDLGYDFESLYIGGGTPTILIDELCEFIDLARDTFHIREVSSETNPNHLIPSYLEKLEGRVQRLSVGVQSFDDGLLKQMDRYDKYGCAAEIMERVRAAVPHFTSMNVDMIFNFPAQTEDMLLHDIECVVATGATQTTFYPLMASPSVEKSLAATVGKVDYAREQVFYEIICELLTGAPYHLYEHGSAWTFNRTFAECGAAGPGATGERVGASSASRAGKPAAEAAADAGAGATGGSETEPAAEPAAATAAEPAAAAETATESAQTAAATTQGAPAAQEAGTRIPAAQSAPDKPRPAMIDEYVVDFEEYPAIGSGGISYLGGELFVNTFSVREYNEAIESGRMSLMGTTSFGLRDRMRYRFMMQLFGLRLDKRQFERDFGMPIELGLPAEMAFMQAAGGFAANTAHEITLTPTGRYLLVVMMRQFFIGVNNLRDQARAALKGDERILIFGE